MVLIFVFFIFLILFSFFALGFIFSSVNINVKQFDIHNKEKINDISFDNIEIIISIKLFKFLKLINIKINEEYIIFCGIKLKLNKLYKIESKDKLVKDIFNITKIIKENYKEVDFNLVYPKLEKFNMKLNLGTENASITSFLIFIVSTFLTLILKKFIDKYDPKKYSYQIMPVYSNLNQFSLKLNTNIKFETINILIFLNKFINIKNNSIIDKKAKKVIANVE